MSLAGEIASGPGLALGGDAGLGEVDGGAGEADGSVGEGETRAEVADDEVAGGDEPDDELESGGAPEEEPGAGEAAGDEQAASVRAVATSTIAATAGARRASDLERTL